ncbi:MAG: class I SAM-dependent methyltransferase [bacterium]
MDIQKVIQENKYFFPYHYIPYFENGYFSQTRNLYWGYEYLSYLGFILDKIKSLKFDSLLDIGCGEGRFLCEINQKIPGKGLAGIDPSERSVSFAKAFNPGLEFICGNIQTVNLQKKFDVITLIEVLEHIRPEETLNFLKALRDHMDNSGFLMLSVPSDNMELNPKHYQHFNARSLKNTLAGIFKIEEIFYLNKKSFKTDIVSGLLSNRFYVLNNKTLLKILYSFYLRNLLAASEKNAKRLCAICRPI